MAVAVACGRGGKRGKHRKENECDGPSGTLLTILPLPPPPAYSPGVEVRVCHAPCRTRVCVLRFCPPRPRRAEQPCAGAASARSAEREKNVGRRAVPRVPRCACALSAPIPAPAESSASVRVSMPGREARRWGERAWLGTRPRRVGAAAPCARARAAPTAPTPPPPRPAGISESVPRPDRGCGREACRREAHHHPTTPFSLSPSGRVSALPPKTQETTQPNHHVDLQEEPQGCVQVPVQG